MKQSFLDRFVNETTVSGTKIIKAALEEGQKCAEHERSTRSDVLIHPGNVKKKVQTTKRPNKAGMPDSTTQEHKKCDELLPILLPILFP
jgi:hypothetical protein